MKVTPHPSPMNVTAIQTDETGISHFANVEIPLQDAGTIGRLSARQPGAGVIFRETDATYDYDWHPAPRRQWLLMLDGEIEIETGAGETRRFRGGDILLLEDVTGCGHRTRQLSSGVRRSVFIPIETA